MSIRINISEKDKRFVLPFRVQVIGDDRKTELNKTIYNSKANILFCDAKYQLLRVIETEDKSDYDKRLIDFCIDNIDECNEVITQKWLCLYFDLFTDPLTFG